ncbi:hypothetical protein [Microbacterium nymphoidis]|uniref:hypothetical protein n=1 Tax=Microbacterium nymphoidis TaxID=2898586 RepID=UPI001E4D2EF7|nr:hypothetical protein [Microbacterium nymphoidis]MCD2499496.1 hypothetical protein [Microbacterium nymphoidis]
MSDANQRQYDPTTGFGSDTPVPPPAAAPWGPDAPTTPVAPPTAPTYGSAPAYGAPPIPGAVSPGPVDAYGAPAAPPYPGAPAYATTPAPSPATPQLNPGTSAQPYASPWTQQVNAAYGTGLDNPLGPRPSTLGTVALVLSLIATVGASLTAGIAAVRISPAFLEFAASGADISGSLAWLSPVAGWELLAEMSFYAGTVLGILAIVLGFVAAAQRRGRGRGIWAIVLGFLGLPVFSGAVVLGLVIGATL